jgi:hypothetical protein
VAFLRPDATSTNRSMRGTIDIARVRDDRPENSEY